MMMTMPGGDEASPTAVTVILPRALLDLFPGCAQHLEVDAATIGGVIAALESKWPGMRDRLCDETPRIRRHLNIFADGRRARLETQLAPGAKVYVLTAMSGG